MKIICGNSNSTLCKELLFLLQDRYKEIKANYTNFADGETYVELEFHDNDDSVTIIQSICKNDDIIELMFIIDILKHSSVTNIIVIAPYFGYARQDRRVNKYSPISIKVIADMLVAVGATKIITVDLHSEEAERFFKIPLVNLSTADLFYNHYKQCHYSNNVIVVAPDIGAKKRNDNFAIKAGYEVAIINKKRKLPGISEVVDITITTNINNKDVIIIDDIVDSAGTLCNSVEFLKNMGAKSVIAYITHGIFSKNAVQKIKESKIDKIYVTNSILHTDLMCEKIKELSLTPLLSTCFT